ncbi:hypothetical protein F5888DRAFT_1868334 [Russula emetica]|nr:hypothetical protein F5888DRAFT_1868334 [Russula emetica]
MSLANSRQPTVQLSVPISSPRHSPITASQMNPRLQIWDIAGQERFSSLSPALFHGADAIILNFDVNQPEMLHALNLGNKTDLAPSSTGSTVSKTAALDFIEDLVPLSGSPFSSLVTPEDERDCIPTQGPDRVSSGSDD